MIAKFVEIKENGAMRQEQELVSYDMQNIPRVGESVYIKSKGKQYKILGVMYDIEDAAIFVYIKS